MENILDDFDDEKEFGSDITEDSLLKDIWLRPTETLSYILKYHPEKYLTLFFIFGGITSSIDRASNKGLADNLSTSYVLLMAVIGGGLFGWITYYFYAWALSATGNWLEGRAKPAIFRTIIAWSLVPTICSLLFLIPKILIFGDDLFRSVPEVDSTFYDAALIGFGLIDLTLGIWTMVIMVKGIAIVQGFTTGKSILNMILPGLVLVGFGIVLGLFFYAFNG